MATEYTRIYTYKSQGNTSGSRSVPLSKFSISGDTTHTIGQITSITYEHWHTSTYSRTWNLRGRLVFSGGSVTSAVASATISGDVTQFINTFTDLPTPEQFATLSAVQTLDDQNKTTSGGYGASVLYWRASDKYPLRLVVKFVEEPPVVYAPSIESFVLQRCDSNAVINDEGQYIATTLKLAIDDLSGLTGAQCRIYYAANAYPEIGKSQHVDVTSEISTLITGVNRNITILSGVWGLGYTWYFAVVFITGEESAIATTSVSRGSTSLHISGEPGGGVCVGGFSSGTTANPKFESAVPGYFYSGIEGVTNYKSGEVATGGTWIDGKPIFRSVLQFETHVVGGGENVANLPNAPETLISARGFFSQDGASAIRPIPFNQFNDINFAVNLNVGKDGTAVAMTFGSRWTGKKNVCLILEYTKV